MAQSKSEIAALRRRLEQLNPSVPADAAPRPGPLDLTMPGARTARRQPMKAPRTMAKRPGR